MVNIPQIEIVNNEQSVGRLELPRKSHMSCNNVMCWMTLFCQRIGVSAGYSDFMVKYDGQCGFLGVFENSQDTFNFQHAF